MAKRRSLVMAEDDDVVTFIATRNDSGTQYTLTVKCEGGLSEEEFSDCIKDFVKELDGEMVTFDENGDQLQ